MSFTAWSRLSTRRRRWCGTDCPFPGGCSLKRPDHLFAWPERYLHVEVDEDGHAGYECDDEDSRLELIAADLGRPGLVVRIDPDFKGQPCFRKVQLCNGEIALRSTTHFRPLMKRVAADVERWLSEPCRQRFTRIHHPVPAAYGLTCWRT